MTIRDLPPACKPLTLILPPLLILGAGPARAHASEQSFVLLLPTDVYIAAGVAAVILTVVILAVLPGRVSLGLFRPLRFHLPPLRRLRLGVSCCVCLLLAGLIWLGLNGPHDPLANPLPRYVWTVWWIALVSLQGLFGNIWRWLNPWTGPAALARWCFGGRVPWRLPRRLGHLGALASFGAFAVFLLADPAPADPDRLARIVALYWVFTFAGLCLFGPVWLVRVEGLTVLMRAYGRLGLFRRGAGFWGWQVLHGPKAGLGLAIFSLAVLGVGSFDGLNETFWWLARIGVNPLEFPGRTAVMVQNTAGLLLGTAVLVAVFALSVAAGLRLASLRTRFAEAFALFAPAVLPIALGYHVAHYLTAFLVEVQYTLAATSDPMATGADLLGLGRFYVTTGFFNTRDSVRVIWLTQAGAVVSGHIIAILLAHALAVRQFGSTRAAVLSQLPLALFMIGYTFFGLWLLASPRG